MDIQRVIRSWRESAAKDWEVAQSLFKLKHYAFSLFVAHLVLEKVLKAIVLKRTKQLAPQIHDLRRLAEMAKLNLTEQQRNDFDVISTFNVRARYDDAKRTFHQKATHAYATQYLKTCEEMYQWLLKVLRSKK